MRKDLRTIAIQYRRSLSKLLLQCLLIGGLVGGCVSEPVVPNTTTDFATAHLPSVPVPVDNPQNPSKIALGRHLFYDKNLSRDGAIACASCHRQEVAFCDGPKTVSSGVGDERGQRNTPMIVNAAYRKSQFWDGRASSLEEQAMGAFLGSVEMRADTFAVAKYLRVQYPTEWLLAFGDTTVNMKRAMQAIASFERALISANSRYDKYVRGELTALNEQEQHGMRLFFSDRTMCASCHSGPDLTDDEYHNIGLFHHYFDRGRYRVTLDIDDEGLFRTPTLRNIELTAPYMATGDSEDGVMLTLKQVVKHYNNGGTNFPNKDKRVHKLFLSEAEEDALVAFMKTLTDSSVITNPKFGPP